MAGINDIYVLNYNPIFVINEVRKIHISIFYMIKYIIIMIGDDLKQAYCMWHVLPEIFFTYFTFNVFLDILACISLTLCLVNFILHFFLTRFILWSYCYLNIFALKDWSNLSVIFWNGFVLLSNGISASNHNFLAMRQFIFSLFCK